MTIHIVIFLEFKDIYGRFYFNSDEIEKVEEIKTEFKVGDWVSSKYFEEVKQIHAIAIEKTKTCNIAIGGKLYNPAVLTLVCGFTKDQKIYVSDNFEDCHTKIEAKFFGYDSSLDCPFVVENENGRILHYNYAKAIEEPEYKENDVEYEIGKKYVVTNYEKNLSSKEYCGNKDKHRILVAYLPNAENPFICVHGQYENEYNNNEKYSTTAWEYAKPIEEPEYKAYSVPKLEWIGEEVKHKEFGYTQKIEAVGNEYVIFENGDVVYYGTLLEDYVWSTDGSACGELK